MIAALVVCVLVLNGVSVAPSSTSSKHSIETDKRLLFSITVHSHRQHLAVVLDEISKKSRVRIVVAPPFSKVIVTLNCRQVPASTVIMGLCASWKLTPVVQGNGYRLERSEYELKLARQMQEAASAVKADIETRRAELDRQRGAFRERIANGHRMAESEILMLVSDLPMITRTLQNSPEAMIAAKLLTFLTPSEREMTFRSDGLTVSREALERMGTSLPDNYLFGKIRTTGEGRIDWSFAFRLNGGRTEVRGGSF